MSRCCCEWEDVYIKERYASPRCCTCESGRSELQVTRKVSRPHYTLPCRGVSCHYLPDLICCCSNKRGHDCNTCLCYECRKIRGRSEASVHRRCHDRYSKHPPVLETWFARFDSDGDGFLDLRDLDSLLKHLGVELRNSYTQTILQHCDRDNDGRLSFPEFVWLWQRAALHDEEFQTRTEYHRLSPIVKKYKLFIDNRNCNCHDYHCEHVTLASEHPIHSVKCNCGTKGGKVIPFIKNEDRIHTAERKRTRAETSTESPDKLPTMSMNRNNVI